MQSTPLDPPAEILSSGLSSIAWSSNQWRIQAV